MMDLLIVILQWVLQFLASRFTSLRLVPVVIYLERKSLMEASSHRLPERHYLGSPQAGSLRAHGNGFAAWLARLPGYDQFNSWGPPPGVTRHERFSRPSPR